MKAIVFEKHGGVEVLEQRDIPEPQISPNEVLICVRATACNYNDIWARRGMPGMEVIFPHISGSDAAGEVVEVGSEVKSVKAGDEVAVHCGLSCRVCAACTSGQEYFCKQFRIWGFQTGPLDGGHAEYCKVPAVNVLHKPKQLSWEEAAAMPLVLVTAWRKLVTRAGIKPGDTLLIWGAAGGLGVMAVQIGKLFRARVIAVVGGDEKIEMVKRLGADHAINRRTENVAEEVKKITNRRGADIVFEHIGAATWPQSFASVKWGGTIVTSGATTSYEAMTDLRHIFFRQLNILGSTLGSKGELAAAMQHVEQGHIKPVVTQVFPLKEIGVAQRLVEEGKAIGKIVLVP
ncbi:MAG: zinc-binding dehydrogenase [Candidatus Methylomirabilales bacterium]